MSDVTHIVAGMLDSRTVKRVTESTRLWPTEKVQIGSVVNHKIQVPNYI